MEPEQLSPVRNNEMKNDDSQKSTKPTNSMQPDEKKISDGISGILESLLFTAGRPLKIKDLAKILEMEQPLVKATLEAMAEERKNHGIVLLDNNGEYQLATNSKYSSYIKNFLNAELREKLTDATVEVLAIIAYRQPISKAEIEAIRGVNSQYSLRHLLIRGLIEKIPNPADARSFLYQTTTEFLMHLGLTSVEKLEDFEKLVEKIKLPQAPLLAKQQPLQSTAMENIAEPIKKQPVSQPEAGIGPDSEDGGDKNSDHG